MKHSTGTPTKAEARHMERVAALGCIACRKWGHHSNAEVHHLLSGNKRRAHMDVLPLCAYHHRGVIPMGSNRRFMMTLLGPSLALESKRFRDIFGNENSLLEEVNALLTKMQD